MNRFTIRGTRGTIPVCGKDFFEFGGSTTCYTLETDRGFIIIDAGTGMNSTSRQVAQLSKIPPLTFLFTHFHIDHIVGLPYFAPLYTAHADITIMADPRRKMNWRDSLTRFMGDPYWPIEMSEVSSATKLVDLPASGMQDLYGVEVSWFHLPHPQQCLSYRLATPDTSVVIATDAEYASADTASKFIDFCRDADHLVFDAHYLPDEYPAHKGWGHSTWLTAAEIAKRAGVKHLVLTHHAPERTDAQVLKLEAEAQRVFANTHASRPDMVLTT